MHSLTLEEQENWKRVRAAGAEEEKHTVARIELLRHEQRQAMLEVGSKQNALQRVRLELNLMLVES